MKYKVGDVVRIISNEKLDEMEKEGIGVYPMAYMIAGLKVEIIEAEDEFYRFNVSSHFMFSEHVIEGLAEPFNKKDEAIRRMLAERIIEYREFVSLVRKMREAQNRMDMLTGEEDIDFIDMVHVEAREAETEVDEYLKKMEEHGRD